MLFDSAYDFNTVLPIQNAECKQTGLPVMYLQGQIVPGKAKTIGKLVARMSGANHPFRPYSNVSIRPAEMKIVNHLSKS